MTNFEKWKDEILRLSKESEVISLKNGTPAKCDALDDCTECGFRADRKIRHCESKRMIWLCEEYKEPIKLTKKQWLFLEVIETGWIVRHKNGQLVWYRDRPLWNGVVWSYKSTSPNLILNDFIDFPFIGDENLEPFSVGDMLTWEVEDD